MSAPEDTIVAPATPAGVSALAIVRVSGPAVPELAGAALGAPSLDARVASRRDYSDRFGNIVDDVVATHFVAPHSYTGEHLLELSPHGNPLIVQKLVEDLVARGCRLAEPGEFTRRAFLNGRLDLSQAEAVADVISARSENALTAAQHQLRGSLGRYLATLTDDLVGALARLEAYIDFPEEDLPPEDHQQLGATLARARQTVERLIATQQHGDLLRQGIRTVLIGEPNVGKSSLLNALLGRERALVSPQPGTTRDYLEEPMTIGRHAFRLIDTAGLNPNPGEIEAMGIARTFEQVAEANLIIVVAEAGAPFPPLPPEIGRQLQPRRALLVVNKCDLAAPPPSPPPAMEPLPLIEASAITGEGMAALRAELVALADALQPERFAGEVIAINARHAHALALAATSLREAQTDLAHGAAKSVLVASACRAALDALGLIAGRIDHEQVLDKLFGEFCIGK